MTHLCRIWKTQYLMRVYNVVAYRPGNGVGFLDPPFFDIITTFVLMKSYRYINVNNGGNVMS